MLQIKQLHGCESAYPDMHRKMTNLFLLKKGSQLSGLPHHLNSIPYFRANQIQDWKVMDNAAPSSSTMNFDLLALKVSVIPCYARGGASTSVIYTCCLFAFILNTETRIFYQSNFLLGLQATLMWIPDSLSWFYAYWCRTNVIPHGTYRVLLSKFWK